MISDTIRPNQAAIGGDDFVLPFSTDRSRINGRVIRLGASIDSILGRHAYPESVGRTLGEAIALTGLVGSGLKFDGRLIVQTKTDGPLGFLVVNYDVPGKLRGYASFDAAALARAGNTSEGGLLGSGHLALTIDQGTDMDRYQGIVPLDASTLTGGALSYFRQSEQLPTFIRVAVARHFVGGQWRWRAGGLMIQRLARSGGKSTGGGLSGDERDLSLEGEDAEDWTRARLLAETVEDHELLDPMLDSQRLLYRLFHEEGVRAFEPVSIAAVCRCSHERIVTMLGSFSAADLGDMREADGAVSVKCEFCATTYRVRPEDLASG